MGLFDHFPYTNVHELNLDWVLSMMKALEAEWEAFTAGNSLTFADPMLHDISKTYAKNTIVLDGSGNAYVSLQAVPVGVGLQNGDYWLMVFDYEAFIEKVNKNFTARYYRGSYRATAAMAIGDWLTVDDVLYKATAAIAVDDILEDGVNITHFTLEDFIKAFMQSATQLINQYKNDIDASELLYRQQLANDIANTTASLQAQLDLAISGATADSEVINARAGWDGTIYSTLGDAIRTQFSEIVKSMYSLDDKANIRILDIALGNLILYKNYSFMQADGTTASGNHTITCYPAEGIKRISFTNMNNISIPVFVIKDSSGSVIKTIDSNSGGGGSFEHIYYFPDGLPKGSMIYCNEYNTSGPNIATKYVTDVTFEYDYPDSRITTGRNIFNNDLAIDGYQFAYNTGIQTAVSNYDCTCIQIGAGVAFKVQRGICHVAYIDELGDYISGDVNTGSSATFTTPAGCHGMIISKIHTVTNFYVGLDTSAAPEDFYWRFNKRIGIKDRTTSDPIHFPVVVNQTLLPTGTTASLEDSLDNKVVPAVVQLPYNYTPDGDPVQLILICHGSGYRVTNTAWGDSNDETQNESSSFRQMTNTFLAGGFAVADVNSYTDVAGEQSWGCPRVMMALRKTYEYIISNYNVRKEILLYGFSMGGLTALNFAFQNRDIVKGMICSSPLIYLYDQVYNTSAAWKEQVATAYGFNVPADFVWTEGSRSAAEIQLWNDNKDLIVGWDPGAKIKSGELRFSLPTIRFWHGKADAQVDYHYTEDFVDAIRDSEQPATLRLVDGVGHEICYGGQANMRVEYLYYFYRLQ